MRILKERPFGIDGACYSWCKKCNGFVIALGKHCFNNDKHFIDYLSPEERKEIEYEMEFKAVWDRNGERIKKYRLGCKVSQPLFAKIIGLPTHTIVNWENENTNPHRNPSKKRSKKVLRNISIYDKLLEIIEKQELSQDPFHDWKKEWIADEITTKALQAPRSNP